MGPSELRYCLLRELRTTTAEIQRSGDVVVRRDELSSEQCHRPDDDERDERDQERVLREILSAFVQAAPVLGGRALSVVSWPPKEPGPQKEPAGLH